MQLRNSNTHPSYNAIDRVLKIQDKRKENNIAKLKSVSKFLVLVTSFTITFFHMAFMSVPNQPLCLALRSKASDSPPLCHPAIEKIGMCGNQVERKVGCHAG